MAAAVNVPGPTISTWFVLHKKKFLALFIQLLSDVQYFYDVMMIYSKEGYYGTSL